jgi:hypothetical protein
MLEQTISPSLVRLGQEVLAEVRQDALRGASIVRLQLVASRFYEAAKEELSTAEPREADRVAALTAVVNQCRRVAGHNVAPHGLVIELRAAIGMLSPSISVRPEVVSRRPTLRVIQGGRAS